MFDIFVFYIISFVFLADVYECDVVLNFAKSQNSSSISFIYHATCTYNDVTYAVGAFQLSKCVNCNCDKVTGEVSCVTKNCPAVKNCLRYYTLPDRCCPVCLQYGCTYDNQVYAPGSIIKPDACTHCYCPWNVTANVNDVTCMTIKCKQPQCVDAVTSANKCCPFCPNGK